MQSVTRPRRWSSWPPTSPAGAGPPDNWGHPSRMDETSSHPALAGWMQPKSCASSQPVLDGSLSHLPLMGGTSSGGRGCTIQVGLGLRKSLMQSCARCCVADWKHVPHLLESGWKHKTLLSWGKTTFFICPKERPIIFFPYCTQAISANVSEPKLSWF